MTAEDPVEFNLPGINQVQVRESIGLNFAAVAALVPAAGPEHHPRRRDPRRARRRRSRVKAALTGHLVLSTLHTNDAPSSINRLVNMGIEPFLVANSVNLICAQRLVRRVCEQCKEPHDVPMRRARRGRLGRPGPRRRTSSRCAGRGLRRCGGTGYKGRVGLFEVMEMTEALRELIVDERAGRSNCAARRSPRA